MTYLAIRWTAVGIVIALLVLRKLIIEAFGDTEGR